MRLLVLALALLLPFSVSAEANEDGDLLNFKLPKGAPALPVDKDGAVVFVNRKGETLGSGMAAAKASDEADGVLNAYLQERDLVELYDDLSSNGTMRLVLQLLKKKDGISPDAYRGFYLQVADVHVLSAGFDALDEDANEVHELTKQCMREISRRLDLSDKYWDWKISPEEGNRSLEEPSRAPIRT